MLTSQPTTFTPAAELDRRLPCAKYHGLGNDYIVINPADLSRELTPQQIRRICDRHYGVGSDGILLGPLPAANGDFGLRIFNPDGSEAEKSGNGLRIFTRYLWDRGLVGDAPFTVATAGGVVTAQVHQAGRRVTVTMGRVSFDSREIPVAGPPREVLNETMRVGATELHYCAATLGNPHCVVLREQVSAAEAQRLGPLVETDALFPRRTNVQFMQVLDHARLRIEIWERGAGYTLASGSSACAAAAVAHRLGLCDAQVTVSMPGGQLEVGIAPGWSVTLHGPVTKVWAGALFEEAFDA
jgi:diaminopimelate epimerase